MRTGAARGHLGNFHEAGFYGSDGEFLALIVPFVIEGLAAAEPVVIGYDARKCDLLRVALPRTAAVTYIADKSLYASPARAIEAYRRQFDRFLAAGAGQIRIAGDVPHEGNGGRFGGWDRYESAVNVVWQDYPVWSRCLYDAATVPDAVRDVVERSHPRLVTVGGASASPRYQDVAGFDALPAAGDPLESSRPALELLDPSPEQARNRVAEVAHGRLGTATTEDLLFAVAEAVVNAQQHGCPPCTVGVWTGTDRVVVHVRDAGPGPADPLTGLVPSSGGETGPGLGLWLSHRLNDIDVAFISSPHGFTVRLRAGRLPDVVNRITHGLAPRAGTAHGARAGRGNVHGIDGDGSSFCNRVSPAGLTEVGLAWVRVPREQRCPHCEVVLVSYGLGQL